MNGGSGNIKKGFGLIVTYFIPANNAVKYSTWEIGSQIQT